MAFVLAHYRRRAFLAALTMSLGAGFGSGFAAAVHADGAVPASAPELSPRPATASGSAANTADTKENTPPDNTEEESILLLPIPQAEPQPTMTTAQRPAPTSAKTAKAKPTAPPRPRITVRKFQNLQWSPGGHHLHSSGSIQFFYQDINDPTDKGTTMTARDVDADAETGQVEARNGVRIERADGTITGQTTKFNFNSRAGYFTDALAETDYFRMSGKRIETQANGAYVVQDGVFTTCLRNRPDYQIRARRLTVSPNRYVSARGITFYAGGTRLISLPSYRRSLRAGSQAPIPTPGYNSTDGVFLRFQDSAVAQPHQTFDYDLRINLRRVPSGLLLYQSDLTRPQTPLVPGDFQSGLTDPLRGYLEQLNPPTYREYLTNRLDDEREPRTTFFSVVQSRQFVYNRRVNNLVLSRYPEVGVRFLNLLGHSQPPPQAGPNAAAPEPLTHPVGSTDAAIQRTANTPFLLDVSASVGEFQEQPTNVSGGRFSLRTDLASQPIMFGKRLSWRIGLTDWFNLYSQGTAYNLLSTEAELNYVPTRTSLFGIGYRYLSDVGSTPFLFDQRDIRHELRLRYQVGGPWAFGVLTKYDFERSRPFDTELAVLRNFDCMQVGLAYRTRSSSFNIIFNLLPPVPDRERRMRTLPTNIGNPAPSPLSSLTSPDLSPAPQ